MVDDIAHVAWQLVQRTLEMTYEVWWALVLGFAISGIVQAWVPRGAIERGLGGSGPRSIARATGWGAASSSCSWAAIAIAKSLFQKGASASSALAFQFASTNLVWELGLVLWLLLGWQFTVAEYVGGVVMIALMAVLVRLFVPERVERQAREHAGAGDSGHVHNASRSEGRTLAQNLRSPDAWSDVAHNFRGDVQMLWRDILIGFVLAAAVSLLPDTVFDHLLLVGHDGWWVTVENALVGPLIAVVSFICSVGNIPLAAVLWSHGMAFAGVLSFIFADLLILPIVRTYARYYGRAFALRIVALMYVTMVATGLLLDAVDGAIGLIPKRHDSTMSMFMSPNLDYRLWLTVAGVALFAALWRLTMRRGATDPMCGMTVDRGKARERGLMFRHDGHDKFFCSSDCMTRYADEHGLELASNGADAVPADGCQHPRIG